MKSLSVSTIRGHSFCAGLLGSDAVVVDMGAHKGEFAIECHERFGYKCHLVEALPSLYDAIGGEGIEGRYNFAIAGVDGPVVLQVSENLEANSIVARDGDGKSVTVEGVTLATFMVHAGLERIDLMKVDIEGAEIALFESADAALLSRIMQITVEFHDFVPGLVPQHRVEEIKDKMRALGFYVIKFSGRLNTDVLFVNKELSRLGWMEYGYLKYVLRFARGLCRIAKRYRATELCG